MIEIVCTDCVKALSEMKPGMLDVVVTSPPYNLGINYDCEYDDAMPRQDYLNWIVDVSYAVYNALSDQGSFFVNVGSKPTDPMIPFEVLHVMSRMFKLQNTIHWVKSISIGEQSVGHYKPINSERFINDCHEYIFHMTKTGKVSLDRMAVGVPYADQSNVKRWSGKNNVRCRGNTWFIPYDTIQSREDDRPHPATFPAELPEMCFRLHGLDRIKWACDPFVGIGNSAIAAKRVGIPNFVGMDLSPTYCRRAPDMLKEEADAV
jgi:site-specific DNA-methyltransferase (adenine-specific)